MDNQTVAPVDDRISIIADGLKDNDFADQAPGLKPLLDDYLDPNVDVTRVDFHRRLLSVFRDSKADNTYQEILAQHTPDEQARIESFVSGKSLDNCSDGFEMGPSMGFRSEMRVMREAPSALISSNKAVEIDGLSSEEEEDGVFHGFVHALSELFSHGEHAEVTVYKNAKFENWGLNISNQPMYTCVPTTGAGIRRIVQFAKLKNMSVRCSGFRHSWSPIFGRNGQILISLLDLKTVSRLPNTTSLPLPQSPPNELQQIELVKGTPRDPRNSLVRVGCAVTNERLRRWCVQKNKVTIPMNVIMVEITLGGSNAPICHGAGRAHKTISDIVREVEYVDANGVLQTVNDPTQLLAASGAFGLLGVVTRITLEFEPMTYALLAPKKIPVMQAVPPPADLPESAIPPALFVKRTPEQRAADLAAFEKSCRSDYYSEWFWFPLSDFAWVNCWTNTTDGSKVVEFPDQLHIFLSFVQTVTMNVLQSSTLLKKLIHAVHLDEAAVTIISRAAMFALPEKAVKTYVPDALHFQRAIQNVRVRDIEVEIPLQPLRGNSAVPDVSICQRAWWDAILKVYEFARRKQFPMTMPLEMRIMGGSDVLLAPQRGNTLGTCAIEVLTLHSQAKVWAPFAQAMLDVWMSYKDASGKSLNTRPHWAKEWYDYSVSGQLWRKKMKEDTYRQPIAEFKDTLRKIGQGQGWTLADLKSRFSNDMFDQMFFDDVGLPTGAGTVSSVAHAAPKTMSQVSAVEVSEPVTT